MLVDGLTIIAATIDDLKKEFDTCVEEGANRAARLVRNAVVEEAGKFLLLIDHFRDPAATQAEQTKHLRRAGNHLAKLLYAQIADYSIGDQRELQSAVDHHKAGLYLDGPNDFDWIFPNELVSEREGALYTDLLDIEGALQWSEPLSSDFVRHPGQPVELVRVIVQVGLKWIRPKRVREAETEMDLALRSCPLCAACPVGDSGASATDVGQRRR